MKPRIIVLLSLLIFSVSSGFLMKAQEVSLITIGVGESKEKAIQDALVAAVEQAYGVYVSGDTHVLNDELVRDEVVQIKRGNIKKYTILSEGKESGDRYGVIIETIVSIENLLKFAQSKGSQCELAGKAFAANLALKKLYLQNGAKAMEQLYHTLGYIVPKMFDYKLNLGEPIVFYDDVYVPVAIDCVLNENFETFREIYNSSYNQIKASIESANVQGIIENEHFTRMNQLNASILNLPTKWVFGFKISDNIGNEVFAVCSKPEYFWPTEHVAPYKIYNNSGRYNDERVGFKNPATGNYQELPENHFIIWEDMVIESHGPRIQKLDYDPLCSERNGGKNLLKSYVKSVEDKFSKARAMGHTDVYGYRDFDERMIDWSDGFKQQSRYNGIRHKWIDDPKKKSGVSVGTIYFFLCYNEEDINKITDIKINSIKEL